MKNTKSIQAGERTHKLNVGLLQVWAERNKQLGVELLAAQIMAEAERERVNAYILPLFTTFDFNTSAEWGPIEKIATPKDLYLCEDNALCAEYFAACDRAHREHGFTGPEGYCPALVAETKVTEAEWTLLAAGAELLGCDPDDARGLSGDNRKKALELFLGMCVTALNSTKRPKNLSGS